MNKKIYFIIIIIFAVFACSGASAQILISQIQTRGATATDEFIELYNSSSTSESLSDFSLKKRTESGTLYPLVSSFPSSSIINAFSYFLIAHRDYQIINNIIPDLYYSNNSNSLATNNTLILYNNSENILDSILLTGTTDATSTPRNSSSPPTQSVLIDQPTETITTSSATTSASSSTIANQTPTSSTETSTEMQNQTPDNLSENYLNIDWTKLKINEIFPAPENGNEWVELYNSGSEIINLSGIFICDDSSSTSSCKTSSSTINPQNFLLINLNTNRYLNNDGDTVRLLDPSENLLDQIIYHDSLLPNKNQSLARVNDGVDTNSDSDWAITTVPTPGTANVISKPATIMTSNASNNSSQNTSSQIIIQNKNLNTTAIVTDTVRFNLKLSAPSFAAPLEILEFSALGSADPRGGKINYAWDFGDSSSTVGQLAKHAFSTTGTYNITLNALSSAGTIGSKTQGVKISNEYFVASGTVRLSEILSNPDGDETKEFIELENTSDTTTSVALWRLINKTTNKIYIIPERTQIPPHNFAVFFRSITKLTLANASPTEIILTNQAGTIKDRVTIPPQTEENKSYARFSNVWHTVELPTPGEINIFNASSSTNQTNNANSTSTANKIKITSAKSVLNNTYLNITGLISTPPGIFGKRFAHLITGENRGLLIQLPAKWSTSIKTGEVVKAAGIIKQASTGKTYLNISTLTKLPASSLSSTPTVFNIEEIDDNLAGALIAINGEITEKKGNTIYVDDDSAEQLVVFKSGANITKTKLNVGDKISATGVLIQNNGHLELWPRSDNDLKIIYSMSANAIAMSPVHSSAATYGFTTLGGMSLLAIAQRLKRAGKFAKLFGSSDL